METLAGPFTTRRGAERQDAPPARLGRGEQGGLDFTLSPTCFLHTVSEARESRQHQTCIQQRRRCHSNTVNSFSRPALNSVITAAAQADVPAEIEHGMSDKMQGWRVTGC